MKKLLLLTGLLPFVAFGQITLTSAAFPAALEDQWLTTSSDLAVDYLTTGANQTWDFSSLVPAGQRNIRYAPMSEAGMLSNIFFGSFAAPEYKASYFYPATDLPLSDLPPVLPFTIDGISQFTKSADEAITLVGFEFIIGGQGLGVKSDTIEIPYQFPLNYGNNWESRGYTNLDMNPIYNAIFRQHRHRVSEVDGWGTVTTPYGTFNALRIHHVIEETDSISIDLLGTGTPMWIGLPMPNVHEYEWRATEEKEAVMRIRTQEAGGEQQVTAVEYRDNYLNIAENEQLFAVYPNPASTCLTVKTSAAVGVFTITSQLGQVVKTFELSDVTGIYNLDISALSDGVYVLSIETTNGVQTRLFSKQ